MEPLLIAVCIAFSLMGCLVGFFTGLIPGIHVNTLAALMMIFYSVIELHLTGYIPAEYIPVAVCCIIMSASVVHSFVDFVPSVYVGAPDGEDCLSILPGHRLLLKGEGMKAVRAAAIGSLIGCSAAILLAIPIQYIMLSGLSDRLDVITKYVLLAVIVILMMNEHRSGNLFWGMICLLLSGALGYMVMELPIPSYGVFGSGTLLMPMLAGLFGIPVMLSSTQDNPLPMQTDRVKDPTGFVPGLKGVLMGSVAGWFPGITSTVGATVSATFMSEKSPERFISTVASIGTVTTVLSLVTLSVSGGGRSGTVIVIGYILGDSIRGLMTSPFLMMLLSAAVASLVGYMLTIMAGKSLSGLLSRVSQKVMNRTVVVFMVILTFLTTGTWGLVILVIATLIGFIPVVNGSNKTSLCGCLIMPVMLM
ncbi:MAG: hypothetical protein E7Z64_07195 [Thermoplasmata archaeon]|nr:hypothetical protein [Thermoplasmata archaeon]